ncbi:MAG: hypothetical protein GF416_00585 [Candidatus Altiarchaeales archaeon]|nr:hypothetical protein [Candidatus Altiarchaeales archaeon]MBD3415615.1 hypothetical protein [Candidatus Altiarchaeales archaeon]
MKNFPNLVLLCSIYLTTILLGLNTGSFLLPLMYPPEGGEQVIAPIVQEPESVTSSLWIFVYIILVTFILLFLLKRRMGFIIKLALFFSFFMGTLFTMVSVLGDWGMIATAAMLALVLWKRESFIVANVALIFTISGIGAILGASLGFLPALVLLVLMSAYDYVAVFVTKHMVTLAEESKGKFAFMFLIPAGDRIMGLGSGDIALPLTFTVSVMASHGAGYAVPTAFGGLMGLVWLYYFIQTKEKITLPALPPISIGLILGFAITKFILG